MSRSQKLLFLSLIPFCTTAFAERPSADWAESWSFPSTAARTNQLIQADMIAKRESGYYDGVGKISNYIQNNVSNAYGVYNQTEYNLTNSGSGNIAATTTATNSGGITAKITTQETKIDAVSTLNNSAF